jgi:hypothetical protein
MLYKWKMKTSKAAVFSLSVSVLPFRHSFCISSAKLSARLSNFSKSIEQSSVALKVRSQLILFLSLCSGVSVPPSPRPTEIKKSGERPKDQIKQAQNGVWFKKLNCGVCLG